MGSFFYSKAVLDACWRGQEQVKIIRVLNTNAVVSLDPCGREIIITGAGIGFKKKKGEELGLVLKRKRAKSWTSPAWRRFIV